MNTLIDVINYLLPLLSLILLVVGIVIRRISYVFLAFWLSLICSLVLYQTAGGEILGSYFGYLNTTIYTLNIIILVVSLIYALFNLPLLNNKFIFYVAGLLSACIITGAVILSINLWINACFIEQKLPGTPIMQVVSFTPPAYCSYRYIFYKVGVDKKISYLCPNYYGLIPAVGHLDVAPAFISRQLLAPLPADKKPVS